MPVDGGARSGAVRDPNVQLRGVSEIATKGVCPGPTGRVLFSTGPQFSRIRALQYSGVVYRLALGALMRAHGSRSLFIAVAVFTPFLFGCVKANASPFVLDYSITQVGSEYQYNFDLVLNNNDGSWVSGDVFNIFIIGDAASGNTPPFGNTASFFTTLPAGPGWVATTTMGGHNGPTLADDVPGGYIPAGLGASITFTGLSTAYVGSGDLLWSILGSPSNSITNFEVAQFQGAVPAPIAGAGLPGMVTVLIGGGLVAWWRRKRTAQAVP
jgi:hypothetical protein